MELMTAPLIAEQLKPNFSSLSDCLKPHIEVENLNLYIQNNHILKNINNLNI